MKISARTRYGLRILLDIASHGHDPQPRTIAAIAKSQHLSAAFISRLAVPLKHAGFIHAMRGIGGGLRLAKSPDDINLLGITEALDGPVSILDCVSRPKSCKRNAQCPVRPLWSDLNVTFRNALAETTLSKVLSRLDIPDEMSTYCI